MKRLFTSVFGLTALWILFGFNSNQPPTGNTGGPGETSCQKSGCHGGGSFTGDVVLSGLPDTAQVGETYTITVEGATTAARAGFELICLDNSNASLGNLTAATGVNVTIATNSRQYARHSPAKLTAAGLVSWTFDWTAPATANTANFYFSMLMANNNGSNSGDNVVLNDAFVTVAAPVIIGTSDASVAGFTAYPSLVQDKYTLSWSAAGEAQVQISDMSGRNMFTATQASGAALSLGHLPAGNYVASVKMGKAVSTARFTKQ